MPVSCLPQTCPFRRGLCMQVALIMTSRHIAAGMRRAICALLQGTHVQTSPQPDTPFVGACRAKSRCTFVKHKTRCEGLAALQSWLPMSHEAPHSRLNSSRHN